MQPFRIIVPDEDVADLRRRLRAVRWPEPSAVADWSQGVPLPYLRELCRYWAEDYDWSSRQARCNEFDQFIADVDGLPIHFVHVRSANVDAVPLLLTHGWPGSFVEFLDVIGPLSERFHVVIPSLPGYAWSGKPSAPGWGVARTADAWATLMAVLGYQQFGAQGGDWGSAVTTSLAVRHPERLVGIHLNMLSDGPPADQEQFSEREEKALAKLQHYRHEDSGYAKLQATRPQTLGYGLADSPVGQCAWILDKFWAWADCDGDPVGVLGADRLLDNISIYWFANTAASSARLYWESQHGSRADRQPVTVPTGVSLFPKDIFVPTQEWAAIRYPNIQMWHELDSGGHFAAFERPDVFVDEVTGFFDKLTS